MTEQRITLNEPSGAVPRATAAVKRAGRAIWEHDNGHTTWPPRDALEIGPTEDAARAGLAAALDVEEMALEMFVAESGQEDESARRIWRDAAKQSPIKNYWRAIAFAVRTAILGTDQ